ncbi:MULTISPECIES: helix-turn-helix domain-containing protein [unclassified Gordonia (in: high G+C Gram-positive bacteria)]|uniref:helix-turn-helix domain-containing protein n=1 Tax=unclassified Gordonia (in: high G+C Gram-positive bacteria) TaxID=2657482 RepID=UPI000ACC4DA6|nr:MULTISPECIES: helix-turn-helix domain-containing protein [unclassified Gordonia (in: high G+C Gram-positive bacteria)]
MGDGGFVRLPYELIDSGRLTQNELTVYIALLRHRDHHSGRCWPSHSTVAKEARVAKSTAKLAIKSLVEKGVVRVVFSEPRKPNVYEVCLFSRFPSGPEGGSGDDLGGSGDDLGGSGDDLGLGRETTHPRSGDDPEQEPTTRTNELAPPNSNHEEALRLDASSENAGFTFTTEPEKPATGKQITILKDLYIHMTSETPPSAMANQWTEFNRRQADERITAWLKAMPRGDSYAGPAYGDAAYNALSTNGQDAADRGMMPDNIARLFKGGAA